MTATDAAPSDRTEAIDIVETVWIPMSDGVHLAAKLWLPRSAQETPVPGVLECIPYRRRDDHAIADHRRHAWMTARGYACLRVDIRGSGDSEGLLLDEYLPREQQDTLETIAWIARQPWCSGSVGMIGLSWGAIAAMQAATHRPPALKAIIPVGGSVDRFYDDGCYFLGALPGETVGWGAVMFGLNARPPDPAVVGDRWRAMWMERLEATPMFLETWLRHPRRDDFWLEGTVSTDFSRIAVPVMGFSGWNDCWPNTLFRLMEHLEGPRRMISGPWGHVYPSKGLPGPAGGFLEAAVAWWDRWLKGIGDGGAEGPPYAGFIQESHPPDPRPSDRPGYWVGEPSWPSPNVEIRTFGLAPGRLVGPGMGGGSVRVASPLTVGLGSGEYMPMFNTPASAELPHDQRRDDAGSVAFDTEPLAAHRAILGTPRVRLRATPDGPGAVIAARLCDVAPDGRSTLISLGMLNLTRREGRETPVPVRAGEPHEVEIRLNDVGYELAPGHRLRLALSNGYWPMAWPLPSRGPLSIDLAASCLILPERRNARRDRIAPPLGAAEEAPPPRHRMLHPAFDRREILEDVQKGITHLLVEADAGRVHLEEIDLEYDARTTQRYSVTGDDPLSAEAEYTAEFAFLRGGWEVHTGSQLLVRGTETEFLLEGRVEAFEGDTMVFEREWHVSVPRDGW